MHTSTTKYYLLVTLCILVKTPPLGGMQPNPLIDVIKDHNHNPEYKETIAKLIVQSPHLINQAGDPDQMTPLHHAVFSELSDITLLLLKSGALIDIADEQGLTALHYASLLDTPLIMKQLIQYRANAHLTDRDGNTPLHLAASCSSPEGIGYLIIDGHADVNARNNNGQTPLHEALKRNDTIDRAVVLIIHKANPAICNNVGTLPITQALEGKNYRAVALLLSMGSPYEKQNIETILANVYPNNKLIPAIIIGDENGIDEYPDLADQKDDFGIHPLIYAIAQRRENVVKKLILTHRIDPGTTTTLNGHTAHDIIDLIVNRSWTNRSARKEQYLPIIRLLYSREHAVYSLFQANAPANFLAKLPRDLVNRVLNYVSHRTFAMSKLTLLENISHTPDNSSTHAPNNSIHSFSHDVVPMIQDHRSIAHDTIFCTRHMKIFMSIITAMTTALIGSCLAYYWYYRVPEKTPTPDQQALNTQ